MPEQGQKRPASANLAGDRRRARVETDGMTAHISLTELIRSWEEEYGVNAAEIERALN